MLTPEYLDTLPDALVELWQQVEDDILRDMARRIAKMDGLTETAAWQAWRLEQTRALHQDVVRLLAKYSGKSDAEIRRILQQAGTETLAADDAVYRSLGFTPSDVNASAALHSLLNAGYRQTLGTWKNLTATTARTVTGQFEAALDRAWLQVSSGAFDYQTAIKRAVDGLAARMLGVTYPTGHHDTVEVAARRAVLTGVNQTCAKLQLARADEVSCEFVEVTAHGGARPSHVAWQGKVYHRGGAINYQGEYYEDFEAATGYGTGPGLCGWNCRHNFHPFFPGISERAYTRERLAELDAPEIEYGGKLYTRYEINQMQRARERRVRAAKRRYLAEDAAGLDTTRAAVRLKGARQKLKDFAYATGGRVDGFRGMVHGFGHSAASKAVWAADPLQQFRRRFLADSPEELLPNYRAAVIPKAKLSGYALNMDHPKGGRDKAIAFRDALGYTVDNEAELRASLLAGLEKWRAVERPTTAHGRPFEVKMLLTGPNGKRATVKTAWQIDNGSDIPRLISVYVYTEKGR